MSAIGEVAILCVAAMLGAFGPEEAIKAWVWFAIFVGGYVGILCGFVSAIDRIWERVRS